MSSPAYCFHGFRLDPASRELWRGKEEVTLQLKVFDCILYLIEHRDRAVGRDELIDAVWGEDVHLSDSVLGKAISFARDALRDTGEDQKLIKTIRGYGYRWVAPIETIKAPTEAEVTPHRRPVRHWLFLVALLVGALTAGTIYLSRNTPSDTGVAPVPLEAGEIALVLPVAVEPKGGQGWIRFGVMELIAERLRDAGQPMVPSETVIALMHDLPAEPGTDGLDGLASTTGAQLVLGAKAEATGSRWRVSLRSLNRGRPPLTAVAEADDVLEAARVAADRLALSLGLTPAPEPDADPGLAMLLRQTEAAMLAQQMDLAQELIESADAAFREQPEVRLRSGWIEYYSYHLESAKAIFGSLLEAPPVQRDPVLRARVLQGLGTAHFRAGDLEPSEAVLEEAVRLLGQDSTLDISGEIQRALGTVALLQGRFELARVHLAQARRALRSTGDARGLAFVDINLGVLEALRDRYADALHYFGSSADALAALHDLGEELRDRVNMIEAHLGLLCPRDALALEPRLNELLAQTANPEIIASANLARAALLAANGQSQAAENLVAEVLRATEAHENLLRARTWALVLRAEQLAGKGDLARAARVAAEVVERVPPDKVLVADHLGRAWLIVLRGRLTEGDLGTAADIAAVMSDWAERTPIRAPKIYAALARAEVAAAEGQVAAAETAFEHALAQADSGQVPLRLLQVAERYVLWLLHDGPGRAADPVRALAVADRVARYTKQDYGAALLQLRVYHTLGPPPAWREALARAHTLAGEREIPPELLVAPHSTAREPTDQQEVTLR